MTPHAAATGNDEVGIDRLTGRADSLSDIKRLAVLRTWHVVRGHTLKDEDFPPFEHGSTHSSLITGPEVVRFIVLFLA